MPKKKIDYVKEGKNLYRKARNVIKNHNLFWLQDVFDILGVSRYYFHQRIPAESELYEELQKLLRQNRSKLRILLRRRFLESDSPALQMALMKIVATEDELRRLSMSYQETKDISDPETREIVIKTD